jgi:hypothetical protein
MPDLPNLSLVRDKLNGGGSNRRGGHARRSIRICEKRFRHGEVSPAVAHTRMWRARSLRHPSVAGRASYDATAYGWMPSGARQRRVRRTEFERRLLATSEAFRCFPATLI